MAQKGLTPAEKLHKILKGKNTQKMSKGLLTQYIHEYWITGHPYLNMSKNKEAIASDENIGFILQDNSLEPVFLAV